jgi:hypothetical protein
MNHLSVSFAGIRGASHYRLVDGEWVDPRVTDAEERIRRFAGSDLRFKIVRENDKWVLLTYA